MTVNMWGNLFELMELRHRSLLYPDRSAYFVGLMLWDVYSRQRHTVSGPIVKGPAWAVEKSVNDLLFAYGLAEQTTWKKQRRFTIKAPDSIYHLAQLRIAEEEYRSDSSYLNSLVHFDLDPKIPTGKGIPHHKIQPLMFRAKPAREEIFKHLAQEFGQANRKWPDVSARIDDLVNRQQELGL